MGAFITSSQSTVNAILRAPSSNSQNTITPADSTIMPLTIQDSTGKTVIQLDQNGRIIASEFCVLP